MKLDIRNKESDVKFAQLWLRDSFKKIRMVYSKEEISDADLLNYLKTTYRTKKYDSYGRLYNNITNENKEMTVETYINTILNENDYILSGYGCLFKSQDVEPSMAIEAIKTILKMRKTNKNKMLEFEEGTYWYQYYNTVQLAYKRAANSYYGVSGLSSSIFYNAFVQNSITLTGRDLITTSISTMESFLGNTNYFNNVEQLFEFINNVKNENSNYDILMYVDRPVTKQELLTYLKTRFKCYIDFKLLNKIVDNLDDNIRTRIYYKNQLDLLLKNNYFIEKIKEFNNQTEYTEQKEFRKIVCEFALYDNTYYDRYNRAMTQHRNSVLVVDTDLRIGSAI